MNYLVNIALTSQPVNCGSDATSNKREKLNYSLSFFAFVLLSKQDGKFISFKCVFNWL